MHTLQLSVALSATILTTQQLTDTHDRHGDTPAHQSAFFQVRTTDDKLYVLRYDPHEDEWTLQSDFDGPELFARSGIDVVTVDAARIRDAASRIDGCEHCHPDDTEIPFDWVLQEVTGRDGMVDFMMVEIAKCPNCRGEISGKTLVEPR